MIKDIEKFIKLCLVGAFDKIREEKNDTGDGENAVAYKVSRRLP